MGLLWYVLNSRKIRDGKLHYNIDIQWDPELLAPLIINNMDNELYFLLPETANVLPS